MNLSLTFRALRTHALAVLIPALLLTVLLPSCKREDPVSPSSSSSTTGTVDDHGSGGNGADDGTNP